MYWRTFSEDFKIDMEKLIKPRVAEDFVHDREDFMLENRF